MAEARAQGARPAPPAEGDARQLQEAVKLLQRMAAPDGATEGAAESALGDAGDARAGASVSEEVKASVAKGRA
eukprot:425312-Prymnesium_polylepis.1